VTSKVNIRVGQAHRLRAKHARAIMSSSFDAIEGLTHQMNRYGAQPTTDDVGLYLLEVRDLLSTIEEQREHLEVEKALKAVDESELDDAPPFGVDEPPNAEGDDL
jgi:hypothetical protein